MSKEEFENADAQVIDMVNDHAAPETVEYAQQVEEELRAQAARDQEREWARDGALLMKRVRRKKWRILITRILVCVLALVLFVAAMLDTQWVPVLCYTGLAVCVSIGSVLIDRHRRGY